MFSFHFKFQGKNHNFRFGQKFHQFLHIQATLKKYVFVPTLLNVEVDLCLSLYWIKFIFTIDCYGRCVTKLIRLNTYTMHHTTTHRFYRKSTGKMFRISDIISDGGGPSSPLCVAYSKVQFITSHYTCCSILL